MGPLEFVTCSSPPLHYQTGSEWGNFVCSSMIELSNLSHIKRNGRWKSPVVSCHSTVKVAAAPSGTPAPHCAPALLESTGEVVDIEHRDQASPDWAIPGSPRCHSPSRSSPGYRPLTSDFREYLRLGKHGDACGIAVARHAGSSACFHLRTIGTVRICAPPGRKVRAISARWRLSGANRCQTSWVITKVRSFRWETSALRDFHCGSAAARVRVPEPGLAQSYWLER